MKSSIIKFGIGVLPWAITVAVVAVVLAFTGPVSAPPLGSGSISIDASSNVGIAKAPSADRLSIGGNVQWSGSLTAGSVPWARLTGFPTCPAGQFATGIGAGKCAAPDLANLQGAATLADKLDATVAGGVTQITAGAGLTASPSTITTTGSLSITAASQSRITGTCLAGQAITAIAANGSVTCKPTPVAACRWNSNAIAYAAGFVCYDGGFQNACSIPSPVHNSYNKYTCNADGTWSAQAGLCSPFPSGIAKQCGS